MTAEAKSVAAEAERLAMYPDQKTVSILEHANGVRVVYEDVAEAKRVIVAGALDAVIIAPVAFVTRSDITTRRGYGERMYQVGNAQARAELDAADPPPVLRSEAVQPDDAKYARQMADERNEWESRYRELAIEVLGYYREQGGECDARSAVESIRKLRAVPRFAEAIPSVPEEWFCEWLNENHLEIGIKAWGRAHVKLRELRAQRRESAPAEAEVSITLPFFSSDDKVIDCIFCRGELPCEFALRVRRSGGETAVMGIHERCVAPLRERNRGSENAQKRAFHDGWAAVFASMRGDDGCCRTVEDAWAERQRLVRESVRKTSEAAEHAAPSAGPETGDAATTSRRAEAPRSPAATSGSRVMTGAANRDNGSNAPAPSRPAEAPTEPGIISTGGTTPAEARAAREACKAEPEKGGAT